MQTVLRPGLPSLLLLALLALPGTALAQGAGEEEAAATLDFKLSPWATSPTWGNALPLLMGGLVGTVFFLLPLVGGVMPGTIAETRLKKEEARIDAREARLEELTGNDRDDSAESVLEAQIRTARTHLLIERLVYFALSALLYATLALSLALVFAQDALQAALYGATATAVVGQLIAMKQVKNVADAKTAALNELDPLVQAARRGQAPVVTAGAAPAVAPTASGGAPVTSSPTRPALPELPREALQRFEIAKRL